MCMYNKRGGISHLAFAAKHCAKSSKGLWKRLFESVINEIYVI